MTDYRVGKTIRYTNRAGKTVTATVERVEKGRRGDVLLWHTVDGKPCMVPSLPDLYV